MKKSPRLEKTRVAKKAPAKKARKGAAHDSPYPQALLDFMMQGWQERKVGKVARVKNSALYAARRAKLSEAFVGEVVIVPTGHERVRANDTHFPFRPGSDFFYLTGNKEPDCVLILEPKGKSHQAVLYVEPNPGRSDSTFFTDRFKGELWVGPRLGVEQSKLRYGVDRCEPLSALAGRLQDLKKSARRPCVVRGIDADVDTRLKASPRDSELLQALSLMRMIKSSTELATIEAACSATRRGFEDIIAILPKAKSERQIEGAFWARARSEGDAVGYNVIAAAGANACVLHWNRNDGPVKSGELLLVDAGVESDELYTADITRTLPISGAFSSTQGEVYDLVIAAQDAAFAAIKPGAPFLAPYHAAMQVLARGLERLKILPMSAEEALRDDNQFYKRYTLHGVSHMLGLDVHDCSHAPASHYRNGELKVGMVLTVEPGLYFQSDDLTVPKAFRGIGIRVEDNVVVTRQGYRKLSDIPRTRHEVEAWMRAVWQAAPVAA